VKEKALQRQLAKEERELEQAKKLAEKEAKKKLPKLSKKTKKKSLIIILKYEKTFLQSLRSVRFMEEVEVVREKEGVKMTILSGRTINLPARYKT